MPTYKGVEVWIEDSDRQKFDYQEVSVNPVDSDDQVVAVKTEMRRGEIRKNAARFYLDASLAVSGNVTDSSINHNIDQFQEYGLRTSKRQFRQGKLGTVEVEIRRIGEIIKGGPGEGADVDIVMVDEPNQPPWLVFRFEIRVKGLQAASALTIRPTYRYALRSMKQIQATGPNNEAPRYLHNSRKRPRQHDKPSSAVGSKISSDLLQQEYQEEEAEERRLLQKLQEQLHNKRARNGELRRLLGETG